MKLANSLQYDCPGQTFMQGLVFIILAQQNVDANCKLEKASCDRILKPILGLCLPARLAVGCPLLPQFEFSLFCLIDKTKAIENGDEQTVKKKQQQAGISANYIRQE